METYVKIEKVSPKVWSIVIDRPSVRNAIDRDTAQQLADAFRAFAADHDVCVGVLCGTGGHFCAGADLKAIAKGEGNRVEPEGDGPLGPTRMFLEKPVICALSGFVVAGGLELALWCDLRVMERSAQLGFFERRWGVPLIDGGTVRLPRLIGQSRALDLILTGRPVGAEEALQIGLVHRLVEEGQARGAAEALAEEIASFPQSCLRNDRRSVYEQHALSEQDALAREFVLGMESLQRDGVEGAMRFASGQGRHGEGVGSST